MALNYNTENNEKDKRLVGISVASTGEKITIPPEVEALTEDILTETRSLSEVSQERQSSVRVSRKKSDQSKENKKQKKSVFSYVVLSILGIVFVLAAVEAIKLMNIFNSMNYVTNSDNTSNTELYVNQAYVQANVSHSDETKNIMLVGYDVDENGISRSDSMIILSLDHEHKKIKMTSLMRDMYLQIPQNGKHKLNASYVYGGADLLLDTVYANFGLEIDNYVCVDYTAFAEIVDYIGGVDIDIDETEIEQFNKYVNGKENQINEAGMHHLNGQQALSYCRIRKVGTDTARTARQRKVLDEIMEKCRKMSLFELENMIEVIAPEITTNFTQGEMLEIAMEGMSCNDYDTLHMRIPVDGTWEGIYIGSTWYMQIDLEQNAQFLNDFIYGDDIISKRLTSQLEENDAEA